MQKSLAVLLLALTALAIAKPLTEQEYQETFTRWMKSHSKSYNHEDFKKRYQIFKANLDFVNEFNSQEKSFTVGMNQFGDLEHTEFANLYLTLQQPAMPIQGEMLEVDPNVATQDSKDWRQSGVVSGVKDQGQCGSCWAFSTTGATESCNAIKSGKVVGLSEQNLVDCSSKYGNYGCSGGLMTQAMQYIIDNKGIDTESSYPYTARDGSCHFNSANVGATLTGYKNVPQGSESGLQTSVAQGPTSVAIDASRSSFQFYKSGVYYEASCSSQYLDHGVLAVGWGTDSQGQDYWIVKNSWGVGWGDQGYILMARNRNNNCGIATMATLPIC